MEKIDIDTWKERYKPNMDEKDPDCFKEYYRHEINNLNDMSHVWAHIQGDIEEQIITGYHLVNVDCFYITELPHNFANVEVDLWTEEDEKERLIDIILHIGDMEEEDNLKSLSLNALSSIASIFI